MLTAKASLGVRICIFTGTTGISQNAGCVVFTVEDKYLLLYTLVGGRTQLSVCRVQAWLIVFLSNSLNNVEGASMHTAMWRCLGMPAHS